MPSSRGLLRKPAAPVREAGPGHLRASPSGRCGPSVHRAAWQSGLASRRAPAGARLGAGAARLAAHGHSKDLQRPPHPHIPLTSLVRASRLPRATRLLGAGCVGQARPGEGSSGHVAPTPPTWGRQAVPAWFFLNALVFLCVLVTLETQWTQWLLVLSLHTLNSGELSAGHSPAQPACWWEPLGSCDAPLSDVV